MIAGSGAGGAGGWLICPPPVEAQRQLRWLQKLKKIMTLFGNVMTTKVAKANWPEGGSVAE
jgi:hypothetical protein